jgi:hypothetical protein
MELEWDFSYDSMIFIVLQDFILDSSFEPYGE